MWHRRAVLLANRLFELMYGSFSMWRECRVLVAVTIVQGSVGTALFIFVCRVFGIGAAAELSLALIVPLAAMWRSYLSSGTWRARDDVVLVMLCTIVFMASAGVIAHWYSTGMDRRHSEYREYVRFQERVRRDPRFKGVSLHYAKRGVVLIRGTVSSDADRKRLLDVAGQHKMPWLERGLEVTRGKGGRKTPGAVDAAEDKTPMLCR